ncbi:MAG: S24 family peptidase [Rikenellaceae bacterium]
MGIKPSFFTEIKKERSGINLDKLQNISEELSCYSNWLLYGEGELSKSVTETTRYSINNEYKGVPYYDVDFIGGFDLVENDQTINPIYHIDFPDYNRADCWVNITGHSMAPEISNGDIIALRKLEDWNTYILYGEIYAIITDEYRTVKRVRKSSKGDNYLKIVPSNKDYDEQDIPKSVILHMYQVLGSARKLF